MANYASKLTGAAIAALLVSIPVEEGIPMKNGMAKPYYDVAGLPTVCYGHMDKKLDMTRLYSMQECENFLQEDLTKHMNRVRSCMTREPKLSQLIAFTSMDFNTGGWCSSRSKREFNLGNDMESCKALSTSTDGSPAWSFVNGKYVKGLQLRRKREEAECKKDLLNAKVSNSPPSLPVASSSVDPLVQFKDGLRLPDRLQPGSVSYRIEIRGCYRRSEGNCSN